MYGNNICLASHVTYINAEKETYLYVMHVLVVYMKVKECLRSISKKEWRHKGCVLDGLFSSSLV
jgi:hypothetical protein